MCNSPLQVQGRRAQSVGEDFPLRIEVGKCSFLLDVGHHGRITHAEAPIDPATATTICQNGEERVLVNVVVTFAEAFRAVLVGNAEAVVRLAAQTYESVTAPFYLEQARGPLVESLARDATRLGGCPRKSGETSLDVVVFVLVTTFGRQPLRPVPEVVFAVLGSDEIIDAFTRQCYIGRVRIHLAVLVERSLDVSTIETAHSVSTIYFDDECDVECKTVTNRLRMKWLLTMATYLSTKS